MNPNEKTLAPKIKLRAYSLKELSGMYECSGKTMKTWLGSFKNEMGPRVGRFYTPKQVKLIFEKLGIPDVIYLN